MSQYVPCLLFALFPTFVILPGLPANSGPSLADSIRIKLDNEIKLGLVGISEVGYSTNITVYNQGLFRSGSAQILQSSYPVLLKIGEILIDIPGPIFIRGHTDNQPIRTLKFPSNWHLSSARANSVVKILSAPIRDSSKHKAEGRASMDPIATNDSLTGRQKNRRIEIRIPRIK